MSAITARAYTTRFAAARRLYEQLRDSTHAELVGATRSWGYPGPNAGAEIVWVGGVDPAEQDPAAIGRGRRDEEYLVDVFIDVALATTEPADVNARLEALTHVVEEMVHLDEHLGDPPLVMWAQVTEVATVIDTGPTTEGAYGGVVRVRVGCKARI